MGPAPETVNAIIEKATLVMERGFILSSWVFLNYGNSGQGFGGFTLGGSHGLAGRHDQQANFAAAWIVGVMCAADVDDWSMLPGRAVRVRRNRTGSSGDIIGIGHITVDDRWFMPREVFQALEAGRAA